MNSDFNKDDLEHQVRAALQFSAPSDAEAARVLKTARGRLQHDRSAKLWLRGAVLVGVATAIVATLSVIMSRDTTERHPIADSPPRELPTPTGPKGPSGLVMSQASQDAGPLVPQMPPEPKPLGTEPSAANVRGKWIVSRKDALEFHDDCSSTDLSCKTKWEQASIAERLDLASVSIIQKIAEADPERSQRTQRFTKNPFIAQVVAHFNEAHDALSASTKPERDGNPLLIPEGLFKALARNDADMRLVEYEPDVFASSTVNSVGKTTRYVKDMDMPQHFNWIQVNKLIASSSETKIEPASPAVSSSNARAIYTVTLTFLGGNKDLWLVIPRGAILRSNDSSLQPVLVTDVAGDPANNDNDKGEISPRKISDELTWSILIPANQVTKYRLEGFCVIKSLAEPSGAAYKFAGWRVGHQYLQKLYDQPPDADGRQQWVWDLLDEALSAKTRP